MRRTRLASKYRPSTLAHRPTRIQQHALPAVASLSFRSHGTFGSHVELRSDVAFYEKPQLDDVSRSGDG